jgi:thiamine biosynthesis lipoprotein
LIALSVAIGLAMACAPRGRAEAPGTGPSAKGTPATQPAPAAPSTAKAPSPKPEPPPSTVGPRINAIPPKLPPNVSAAPSSEPAAEPEMHRTERRLMGTIWMVGISGGDEKVTKAVSEEALDEVERLEAILSEWKPDSEVSHVNAAAGVAPVKVGPELMTCVQTSQETARWSHGAYDISWAALRDLWDFGPNSKETPPTQEAVKARLPLWNYKNIVVDAKKGTIFLRKKGMQIGLGGIAKGYALDRASAIVQQAGFNDFLIFGGGQVLVHGHRGKRLWRVGIQNPRDSSYFGFVDVTDVSVSTSGDYEHSYFHEGKRYHHIIDPKTGFPAAKTASVTVIAKTALWADAVDTAAFVLGPVEGKKALAKTPAGAIEGVFVDPELRVSATPGAAKALVLASHLDPDGKIGAALKPGDPMPKLVPAP